MNCAINATATEERRVGSVHNRVHRALRDVAADDFHPRA